MLYAAGTDHMSIYETKVIYPAFCFVLWSVMYSAIPEPFRGMSSLELRTYQWTLFGFVLVLLVTVICLWELLKKSYRRNSVENVIFALSMILSGPMLFAIERGNIILLAFAFIFIFGLYYNSANKYLRYLSYIALAVAAAIKIYPALFGMLIISHKRWKESFIAVGFGIIIFVLPFMEFGGLSSIATLFQNIISASPEIANRGCGINCSFANLIKIVQMLGGNIAIRQTMVFKIIPACIAGFIYMTNNEEWKKMFAIVLFCIWVPEFSYTYTLIFFILPFLSFLKNNEKMKVIDGIYMVLFIIIFLPTATAVFPQIDIVGAQYPLSGSILMINGSIIAFSILLMIDGISHIMFLIHKRLRN